MLAGGIASLALHHRPAPVTDSGSDSVVVLVGYMYLLMIDADEGCVLRPDES